MAGSSVDGAGAARNKRRRGTPMAACSLCPLRQNAAEDYGKLSTKQALDHSALTALGAVAVLKHTKGLGCKGLAGASACHAQLKTWSASEASRQKKKVLVRAPSNSRACRRQVNLLVPVLFACMHVRPLCMCT